MLAKRVKSLSWPFPQFISSEQTQTKEVETWGDNVIKIPALFHPKTMFMLYQIAIAQARKPYRIGLLFTGHMRTVISSDATPRRSWKWIITYRIAFCATLWRSIRYIFHADIKSYPLKYRHQSSLKLVPLLTGNRELSLNCLPTLTWGFSNQWYFSSRWCMAASNSFRNLYRSKWSSTSCHCRLA